MTQRREFSLGYIGSELARLDSGLSGPLDVYVAGGFVMAHRGLKAGTKDIDVVLEDKSRFRNLVKLLLRHGYRELAANVLPSAYVNLFASAILENSDGFRWAVFEKVVADKLALTETMKSRATLSYKKGKLTLFLLSKEDVFLMKSVTDRDRDLEDMFVLARSGLDYDAIFEECLIQSELTDSVWESGLYERCEELDERYGVKVPFLNRVRRVADEKTMMRALTSLIRDGRDSEGALIEASGGKLRAGDVSFGLKALLRKGRIKVADSGRITLLHGHAKANRRKSGEATQKEHRDR
jgi:hypothetical protein